MIVTWTCTDCFSWVWNIILRELIEVVPGSWNFTFDPFPENVFIFSGIRFYMVILYGNGMQIFILSQQALVTLVKFYDHSGSRRLKLKVCLLTVFCLFCFVFYLVDYMLCMLIIVYIVSVYHGYDHVCNAWIEAAVRWTFLLPGRSLFMIVTKKCKHLSWWILTIAKVEHFFE